MKDAAVSEEFWPLFASAKKPSAARPFRPKLKKLFKPKHTLATAWAARKRLLSKSSRRIQRYWQDALLPE